MQKVGKGEGWRVCTNLNASEGYLISIFGYDERTGWVLVIQYSSGFDGFQILVANILDDGNDPQFGRGCDFVGGSREGNLKTGGGTNHGFGVSTDGRKTKSDEG